MDWGWDWGWGWDRSVDVAADEDGDVVTGNEEEVHYYYWWDRCISSCFLGMPWIPYRPRFFSIIWHSTSYKPLQP